MTTNNPLLTVQRMFEALAKLTWIACLRPSSRFALDLCGANPRPAKRVYVGRRDVREFFAKSFRI
jgi:hypothetical protein